STESPTMPEATKSSALWLLGRRCAFGGFLLRQPFFVRLTLGRTAAVGRVRRGVAERRHETRPHLFGEVLHAAAEPRHASVLTPRGLTASGRSIREFPVHAFLVSAALLASLWAGDASIVDARPGLVTESTPHYDLEVLYDQGRMDGGLEKAQAELAQHPEDVDLYWHTGRFMFEV